jgi:glyoxylase-like metal-dependent hydrolase (beta-lactamase superfamily II)
MTGAFTETPEPGAGRGALPVRRDWFARRAMGDGLTLLWEPAVHPLLRCNIWLVAGRDGDLLVDTGLGLASLVLGGPVDVDRVTAVATHYHYDHTGGLHEFTHRAVHRAEAPQLTEPGGIWGSLLVAGLAPELTRSIADAGYVLPGSGLLLDAQPYPGLDVAGYAVAPAPPTRLLAEGDVLDLGDRALEVLHLPGHSPGSIGLWEAASGTLFSGDAIYDGPLLDCLPDSDREAYARTLERLITLPVEVVHGGHDPSFGRERLIELCRGYLDGTPPGTGCSQEPSHDRTRR